MKSNILEMFENEPELKHFRKIIVDDITTLSEDLIFTSGYVVDTLEASLWSVLTSSTYSESVLKAVNLGNDTDTTGAIAGGLAGLIYGIENIPKEWVDVLARKEDIFDLAERLQKKLKI